MREFFLDHEMIETHFASSCGVKPCYTYIYIYMLLLRAGKAFGPGAQVPVKPSNCPCDTFAFSSFVRPYQIDASRDYSVTLGIHILSGSAPPFVVHVLPEAELSDPNAGGLPLESAIG